MRAALALLVLLSACGPSAPPAPPGGQAPAADAAPQSGEVGRVLALRALAPSDGARERITAQLLPVAAGPESGGPLALEVLVRVERTGRDVALFAEADPRLRVGDRVSLLYEPRPRLRRLDGT
jgi:hypothetical protein